MTLNELPKRRKIQDFFAAGDPVGTNPQPENKKERICKEKQKRFRLVTYLEEDVYRRFVDECENQDLPPAVVLRQLVRNYLKSLDKGAMNS